jgi:hypothetical protein
MHKASTQNFTRAYDAYTIIIAKMALAAVAANSNVSPDIAALIVFADHSAVALKLTAAH